MQPVTTAIIGCGPRSRGHVEGIQSGNVLTLKYACDILPDRMEEASAEWGVPGVLDYREILDDPDVEAVNIVTDVANHLPIVRDALNAGKHIICEKPFGADIAEARRLVGLVEQSDRVAYISFQLRFSGSYAAMKDAAETVDPMLAFMGRSRGIMKKQFLTQSPFHGIMDFLAHDFDVVAWMMGRAPEKVTSIVRRNTFTPDTGATDMINAMIDFGDERCATILSSIGAPEIGSRIEVTGACGNLRMVGNAAPEGVTFNRFEPAGPKKQIVFSNLASGNADAALQHAFVTEIRTGRSSRAARFRDGLNSLLLTMACLKSMDEQRTIALDEL